MNVEGKIVARGDETRVHIAIEADKAGRIIGKRGSTLSAIRHLLGLALESFGEFVVDVDIADNRESDRPRRDRGERNDRGRDRDRGRGRDRDRDRDRDGKRGRRRGRGDRDDSRQSRYPSAKLEAVGRRAAEKVSETGRAVTINLQLNSYDRRILHMAVAEIEGVASQSVLREDVKYVQVLPESD
jgi:predicted RNA-binding protein Jag